MTRDLRRLGDTHFDLIVVGGGIYGTTAAWDATQRGLSVALVDRADFGGGTSFNSAKTVHGGVRALQTASLRELGQFVRERRSLSRIAPHLIDPLPFVIPTYGRLTRNRWLMRTYFAAYDLASRERNEGLDPSRRLPASRLLSREECLALGPSLDPADVTGGIEWYDCQMYNSDRVNLSFILTATDGGATAVNYAEVTGLIREGSRVGGVRIDDRLGGERLDVRGSVVMICGGPWAPSMLRTLASDHRPALPGRFSKAMNLITDRPLADSHACATWADGRLLFITPWRGQTIIGTSHHPFEGDATELAVRRDQVEEFVGQVNQAFPRVHLDLGDLRLVHCGLLPAMGRDGRHEALRKTSLVTDHRPEGLDGLVSVLGVRYTTARDTAQRAVDTVFELLGKPASSCRTAQTPLAGGDIADVERFLGDAKQQDGVRAETGRRLARSYGTRWGDVLDALRRGNDGEPLGSSCPVTRGEIRHAVRHEMAVKLSDAVLRRTEAGSAGHPGIDALRSAATVMGAELDWPATRVADEIRQVEAVYEIPE